MMYIEITEYIDPRQWFRLDSLIWTCNSENVKPCREM